MNRNLTGLLVVTTIITCFLIGAVVAVTLAAPEGANTGSLLTILSTSLASVIGITVAVATALTTKDDVRQVKQHTTDLTNGLMDAKIRAALVDVLPAGLVDMPDAQVEADQARRDQGSKPPA